jgi:heterodisulfide reductase subunit A
MKKRYGAVVIGAGIGGIRAALDLAETGQKVALVDRRPTIGGLLMQLDYQFPSDHCGMCKMLPLTERDSSSQFCLRKGLFHKNIDIHLSTDLVAVEGDPGTFQVMLSKRSGFVDPSRCIGCGECSAVCPVTVSDDFNAGLSERSAVYLPMPLAIPNHYTVDLDHCRRCWQCFEACPTGAIDFKFKERESFGVLIAEADDAVYAELEEWLKSLNFPVERARTGEEVLARVSEQAAPRMVLYGMALPGESVERVVSRGIELHPEMLFLLMGGEEERERAEALVQDGARAFVPTPLEKADFVPWLDKLYMRHVTDEPFSVEAAAVVLAAGFDCYDPATDPFGGADVLGYGSVPGVVTSLEFERLASSTGPTGGRLLVPGTERPARRIAWLQCVGSRDVQKRASYCSSICCMISIKEALLARRRLGPETETAIFYMDMRTFGKDYEMYRHSAEHDAGVRFIPARIHSVTPVNLHDPAEGLVVEYLGADGTLVREVFDMLVLAVGARAPKGTRELADAAGVDLNDHGWCQTQYFDPSRTSRLGVYAAGSFGAPRDIAETIVTAGAAAAEASRLINIYAPLKEQQPDPEPEYRDVSRETPRTLLALCSACPILEQRVDMDDLTRRLSAMPNVVRVEHVERACTGDGWERIVALTNEVKPNRLLIGACMPYAYVPRLRELGASIGLKPALMDVADIYTPLLAHDAEANGTTTQEKVFAALNMAAVRLQDADPSPLPPPQTVAREALVLGGGLAGMTAAMSVADHGYNVCLVEEGEELGGLARHLRTTLQGEDPQKYLTELVEQVEKHPYITVRTESRAVLSMGRAGRFMSVISTPDGALPLEHGVSIIATGGREGRIWDYSYRVDKRILSQLELEDALASGTLDTGGLRSVVMVQCWRSRDGHRNYCSRVCCQSALKNLLHIKRKNPDVQVYVFYRDIMTYGFAEDFYTEARRQGAIFIRYDVDSPPQVKAEGDDVVVRGYDPVLRRDIEIRPDLVALATGIEPGENADIAEVFGVQTDENGFFREAESKWRPVDFLKQGVFVCGLARGPGSMAETVASAKAAAQRAVRILSVKRLTCGNVVAEVRDSLCSRCGLCIDFCPYGARRLDLTENRIKVDELLCQGCGSCTAVCPNSASVMRGFRDAQMMKVIDAALTRPLVAETKDGG